jgi:hypothetical protein
MDATVMGNEFARKNMWDTDYRPEQMFTRDILSELYPKLIIKTEFIVSNLTLDGKPYRYCKPDIAIPEKMFIIRLNGMYHYTSDRQRSKDDFQKEALKQAGWQVVDFDCRKMENLFKRPFRGKTVKLAEEEVLKELGKVQIL